MIKREKKSCEECVHIRGVVWSNEGYHSSKYICTYFNIELKWFNVFQVKVDCEMWAE